MKVLSLESAGSAIPITVGLQVRNIKNICPSSKVVAVVTFSTVSVRYLD